MIIINDLDKEYEHKKKDIDLIYKKDQCNALLKYIDIINKINVYNYNSNNVNCEDNHRHLTNALYNLNQANNLLDNINNFC